MMLSKLNRDQLLGLEQKKTELCRDDERPDLKRNEQNLQSIGMTRAIEGLFNLK